jgi:hypothetical protein
MDPVEYKKQMCNRGGVPKNDIWHTQPNSFILAEMPNAIWGADQGKMYELTLGVRKWTTSLQENEAHPWISRGHLLTLFELAQAFSFFYSKLCRGYALLVLLVCTNYVKLVTPALV